VSQVYATPSNMWEMALPPDTLFNDQGIEAGAWSDPVFTGVGTGFLDVSLNSNPRSEFSVIVKCVKAGELNVYGFINPGSPPRFILSLDNGLSFSKPYEAVPDRARASISYQKGGFTLDLDNGTAPSFVVNDQWSFTTSPSPDIITALSVSSRMMDSYIGNSLCLPLISWGDDVRMICCQLARWYLITRRGLDRGDDMKIYYPEEAYNWLCKVALGDLQSSAKETGGGFVYPQFAKPSIPFKTYWRF
jgi:hypothetical protein